MKRDRIVAATLTLEEWKLLREKIRKEEDIDNKTYTVSSYIRSKLLLPHLNGYSPPSIPDSKPKNVSPDPGHTDSKQKNKGFDNDFIDNWDIDVNE